jgi:hypothetical protein
MALVGRRSGLVFAATVLITTGCGSAPGKATTAPTPCAAVPPIHTAQVSFYDPDARKVAIYGGSMWMWDGRCWAEVASSGDDPGEQANDALVTYDPEEHRVILFGGTGGEYRHMWAWARGRWTSLGNSPAVPTALSGAIAYDTARHQLVVLGMPPTFKIGRDDPRVFSPETWLWDGHNTWRHVQSAHTPPPNGRSSLFDPGSGAVLAAAPGADPSKTDVWSWNGIDWRLLPGTIPSGNDTLVDGGDLGVLAVERGSSLAPLGQVRRVFRVEGGQWLSIGPSTVGPSTVFVPMYDAFRKQLVAFSDVYLGNPSGPQVFTQDTWTWTQATGWTRHAGPAQTPSPSPFSPPPIPSPTPCPSPTPLSSFAASTPSDRTLALVTLRGSDQVVVRDITDINHPSTIATLSLRIAGGPSIVEYHEPTFVNANEVTFNDNGLMRMPISGSPRVQAAVVCPNPLRFAWSRDGRSLTYLAGIIETTQGSETLKLEWHLINGGADRVIGTAPGWRLGVDFGGWDVYDYRVAFSPDGSYLSLVENFVGAADFQIRRMDGTLVTQIKSAGNWAADPTMSVWSGSTLYFRDSQGVEAWKDGTVTPFLPGVAWIRPNASPTGGQITYAVLGTDGLPHVYLVDTGTRKVVQVTNTAAADPVFLSARHVWYTGLQLCNPPGSCAYTTLQLTGKTYIYDLQAGSETQSRITAVFDIWPHGS